MLNQAAPNQNQWYPVLDAQYPVRIKDINMRVNVAGETIECIIQTPTGQHQVFTIAAVAGTVYEVGYIQTPTPVAGVRFKWNVLNWLGEKGYLLEATSVNITIRKTTLAGAGNLQCMVQWERVY